MSKKRILIVDDEVNIRKILQMAFDKAGYIADITENGYEALQALSNHPYDLVLSDVTMPGMTGCELLIEAKAKYPDVEFVIMTAFGTIPQALQAIRDGAYDYVTKPFDLDHIKQVVATALASGGVAPGKKVRTANNIGQKEFLAVSPKMQEVLELVRQVADTKATVMIGGESGVGKEVIARSLHQLSSRSKQAFVAVSCAAFPETLLESELFGYEKGAFTGATGAKVGKFESADSGTLFLDEVGEFPASVQVKLLRVLQEREIERLGSNRPTKIDVRLITATHRNLHELVDAGTFRLDLLYRLQVIEIQIPALRDRVEDIVPLANLFLERKAAENGRSKPNLSSDAIRALESYQWPGNVRELENAMERSLVLAPQGADEITTSLLPSWAKDAA